MWAQVIIRVILYLKKSSVNCHIDLLSSYVITILHGVANMYLFYDSRWDMVTGAQKSMLSLAEGLRERHKVELEIASVGMGPQLAYARSLGFKVSSLGRIKVSAGFARGSSLMTLFAHVFRLFSLFIAAFFGAWLVYKRKPHIIYINDAYGVVVFGITALIMKIPLVYYVRSDKKIIFFSRLALILSDKVFFISEGVSYAFSKKDLYKHREKIEVLMTGFKKALPISNCKLDAIAGLNREQCADLNDLEYPVYLLLGSYDPRKGHLDAVDAFEIVRNKLGKGKLVFAGHETYESQYISKLKRHASKLNVIDDIIFLSSTKYPDVLLSLCDVVILPSKSEGLPRVLIEGLMQGTPAISYPVSGADIILRTDLEGTVTESADPVLLAEAMIEWYNKLSSEDNVSSRQKRINSSSRFDYNNFVDSFYISVQSIS